MMCFKYQMRNVESALQDLAMIMVGLVDYSFNYERNRQ